MEQPENKEEFDPDEFKITGSKKESILEAYDIDVTGDIIGQYEIKIERIRK